jgi:hypothetical protein
MKQDPLNNLLRQWAERQTPDAAETGRIRDRISKAVQETSFLHVPPPERPWQALRGRGLWFALGAAAAVVAMFVLRIGEGQHSQEALRGGLADDVPASVRFDPAELAKKAGLLSGMQDVFAGRLAWIGEAGRQVQVGLLPEATPGARGSMPLVVRVVVLARNNGDSAWKAVGRPT